jgi:hypothetical protein
MGRGAVQVKVVLFDVLAVVAFTVGQAEAALLENGILAIPERQGEAELLLVVGEAGDAVFPPAVGPGAGLVMGEEVPGIAVVALILPHRTPLALAQVWAPLFPRRFAVSTLFQPHGLFRFHCHGVLRSYGVVMCSADIWLE